jgi:hypothetical protein
VLELNAMSYFQTRIARFTADSTELILEKLADQNSEYESFNSSRLAGRQLKTVVHALMVIEIQEILEILERHLRASKNINFAVDLAAMLGLSMVMEDIQVAGLLFNFAQAARGNYICEGTNCQGFKDGRSIEEEMFVRYRASFHETYKTWKRQVDFNPIAWRLDPKLHDKYNKVTRDWNESTRKLVNGICRSAKDSCESLWAAQAIPRISEDKLTVVDDDVVGREQKPEVILNFDAAVRQGSAEFERQNPGRLIKRLLVSFLIERC